MGPLRRLRPHREEIVLFTTSLPLLLKLYKSAPDEYTGTNAVYLTAISIASCLLESAGLPVSLKREGSPGLFYGLLLVPAVLLSISVNQDASTWYGYLTRSVLDEGVIISFWMVLYILTAWHFRRGEWIVTDPVQSLIILLITGMVMGFFFKITLTATLFFHMSTFLLMIQAVSSFLPKCFTLGELLLLGSLFVPFLTCFNAFHLCVGVSSVTNWVLLFVFLFLLSLVPLLMARVMSVWTFYSSGILLLVCLLLVLFESLPQGFFWWTIAFISDKWPSRQFLLILWTVEIFTCAAYVTCFRATNKKSSTSERKFFHLFILVTFIPGLLYDASLLFFCSVGAFCIVMILEAMRVLEIPPLSKTLNERFAVFVDPQDSGRLILTPIYLLLGQSLPIWAACLQDPALLSLDYAKLPLAAYSGILSVGIGDTAASVVGSKWGRHKWKGTNKTVEGTLAAVAAQFTFILIIFKQCSGGSLLIAFAASLAVSATEAFTQQIDNLVLPIYMYFLLNASL